LPTSMVDGVRNPAERRGPTGGDDESGGARAFGLAEMDNVRKVRRTRATGFSVRARARVVGAGRRRARRIPHVGPPPQGALLLTLRLPHDF
jgi:hypothetical protein